MFRSYPEGSFDKTRVLTSHDNQRQALVPWCLAEVGRGRMQREVESHGVVCGAEIHVIHVPDLCGHCKRAWEERGAVPGNAENG